MSDHTLEASVRRLPRWLIPLAIVAAFSGVATSRAAAQLPIPSLELVGGVSHYDLSGTGTTPFGAVRVAVPLFLVVAEGSLGVMRPSEQLPGRRTYVIPEVQLQYQFLPLLVKPYVGVGAGWFRAISGPTPHTNDLTLSASAGLRVSLPLTGLGLLGEVRLRGVGSGFARSATEWTLGLSF